MIRFTWLQARTQTLVALCGLAVVAVLLMVTGPHLAHLYATTVATCAGRGDCPAAIQTLKLTDHTLSSWLRVLVLVVPGIVGIFWGAPLVARELEAGTHRLVWTQSVTRSRWMAVKLMVVGLASVVVGEALALMVSAWARPLDRVNLNRLLPGVFDGRGIVAIGYAALAFALGVTAGLVIRRSLPAMAAALAAFVAARLAIVAWVRPHLLAPAHAGLALTSAPDLGFGPGPAGETFSAGAPTIPNAWVVGNRIVDSAGHLATPQALHQFLHQFLESACPAIVNPPAMPAGLSRAPANQAVFQDCLSQLSARFHEAVTYQPANRFWPLQGYELAVCLMAAALLAGFCIWWVRRRTS